MPEPLESELARAVKALRRGGLVVYPTDTLLGLAARADDPAAVQRLIEAKARPGTLPLSVAVSSLEEVDRWTDLSDPRRAWIRRHLPGPYTALLPASSEARTTFAPSVLGPGGTLGIRIPDHPLARSLAELVGPMTATSANRHGEPPARSLAEARRTFGGDVAVYLDGAPAPSGRPSELVDLTGARPRSVRRG
ncbi:MAG: threonylcarbamoyl-AMP synthase [Thermoplasmata archaeon]|nr:threonylcarbamoyl-AMP synthase [Thermoplasmata archaeon]MCI4356345.1 threonylcarbamoyl-AMP synthase [Thermoplasmata archaeon]